MSNNYEDEQSEDGELARSPIQDDLDFSLSDEDQNNADSLVIIPPQAVIRSSHRDKRSHKRSTKERYKEPTRKEKKHIFREREKPEKAKRDMVKSSEREELSKEFYRDKQYYREKEAYREKDVYRDKEVRDKDVYRERDGREKELYRDTVYREKEAYREREHYKERDVYRDTSFRDVARTREAYREKEIYKDKDLQRETTGYRDKEIYKDKEPNYRDKEPYKEKEVSRENYREKDVTRETYRDKDVSRENYREKEVTRENYRDKDVSRENYRDKDVYKDKDLQRDAYLSRERQYKYTELERKRPEIESRLRLLSEEGQGGHSNEKENRDRTSGDKELEDLRSRLLSKRISKELQTQDKKYTDTSDREKRVERASTLDKNQEERRKKLLEADREMEKRKHQSRTELEARREERRRRGKKRSGSPDDSSNKKNKKSHSPNYEDVVTVSDASDVDMKSESPHSEPEEGEHSNTETEDDSSGTVTDSEADSKSEDEDVKSDKDLEEDQSRHNSKSPSKDERKSPSSAGSRRSHTRSKSRSRSHSFSPPHPGENGQANIEEEKPTEDDESAKIRQDEINALPPYFPALQGCRSVEEFQCLNRIEEGTYGVVYRARDKTTEEIVALKRLKMEKEKEGFPITSLREINTLLKGQHPNIVTVREIVVGSNMDKIFIVMDYVEHDLKSLMETMRGKKQGFLPGEVKCLMTQLLRAVHHLHDNWILHRDLKTSNLLLSHKGVLKVGDFGLAREYGSPLRPYTPIVVTLWYRAPELLLCCREYSTHIDMWSVGCIFAEFLAMNPLFPGKSEVDQLNRIFKDLGTPTESVWPGYKDLPAVQKMTFADHPAGGLRQRIGPDMVSEVGMALLQGLLTYNPVKRLTAEAGLEHNYFKEHPVAIDPQMFPTWPAKSEGNRRATHSPRPPAGGAAYAQHSRADSDEALGFQLQQRSLNVAPGFSLKF